MELNNRTLEAVEVLKERELDACAYIVTKPNGDQHECVVIREEGTNIAPNIYTENLNTDSAEELADKIVELHQLYKPAKPIDTEHLFTRENLSEHIFPVLLPEVNDEVLSRDFLDLKVMLRVRVDDFSGDHASASFAIRKAHLEKIDISEQELFEIATLIMADYTITSMTDTIREMMEHAPEEARIAMEFALQEVLDGPQMYVVSNKNKRYGAANLLNNECFKEICHKEQTDKLVIIPTSVHELIVLDYRLNSDTSALSGIIGEVNTEAVAPEERLSTHPYYYWLETNEVTCEPAWDLKASPAAEKLVRGVFGE